MDETEANGLKSPTREDHERPSKRQKIDESNQYIEHYSSSSSLSTPDDNPVQETDSDPERAKRAFEAISNELDEIGADQRSLEEERDQLKIQVRLETEKIARLHEDLEKVKKDKEEETAKLQAGMERSRKAREEVIAQLQRDLEKSTRDMEELRRSQASARAKLLQLNAIIEEKIRPLLMDSSSADTSTESESQEESNESIPEVLMEVPLSNAISQEESNPQDIQLPKTPIAIQTIAPEIPIDRERTVLEAKAERVDELEKELQMARATILSLHEAESEKRSRMQQRIDENEKLQQKMKIMEKKLEILSSRISEDELTHNSSVGGDVEMADVSGGDLPLVPPEHSSTLMDQYRNEAQEASSETSEEESSSSNDGSDVDEESSAIQEHEEQRTDGPQMWVGTKYSVLVSSSKFFGINWNDEFTRTKEREWVCKKCPRSYTHKDQAEDHAWVVHHGGKFQCPHCTLVPKYFKSRSTAIQHIRKVHSSSDQSHDEPQEASEEESPPQDVETDVDEESSEDEGNGPNDSRLVKGKNYSYLIPTGFFDIDWKEEFSQTRTPNRKQKCVCRRCRHSSVAADAMKDHVWNAHYSGIFKCPHCTESPEFQARSSVRSHIKRDHK